MNKKDRMNWADHSESENVALLIIGCEPFETHHEKWGELREDFRFFRRGPFRTLANLIIGQANATFHGHIASLAFAAIACRSASPRLRSADSLLRCVQ